MSNSPINLSSIINIDIKSPTYPPKGWYLAKGGSRGMLTPYGKYLVNTPLYLPLLGESSVKLLTAIFISEPGNQVCSVYLS